MKLKKITGAALIILALVMFFLAFRIGGLPPAVTGVGFMLIGITFLSETRMNP